MISRGLYTAGLCINGRAGGQAGIGNEKLSWESGGTVDCVEAF